MTGPVKAHSDRNSKYHGSRLIRNSVLNLFNTFFMMATSWIISIWVARQLGPGNYGIFTLVLWFVGTFTWVIGMGLIHATTKFVAEYSGRNETDAIGPIVVFVLKIEVGLTIFVSAVLIFFRSQVSDYFFTPSESFFFLLAFLGMLPGIVTAVFSATIEGTQKFQYFTYANLLITPFSFISKVIVLSLGKGIEGLLIVMLVFSVVNSLFYFFVLRREGINLNLVKPGMDNRLRKRIGRYNMSVLAIILCDKVIWDKSENFFLGRFCAATEIGFYNLGFNIAHRFTSVLPTTFWRVLFPAMSSYSGSGHDDKTKRVFFVATRYLAFAAFPVGIAGAILAYQMIHYLYGHDFIGAQRVLQIMFLSSIVTSICNPGAAVLYGYEKQDFIYKLGAVMATVNIILDIFLIRPYGAVGAAACFAFTTVTGSIIGTVYTCRIMKLRFPIVSVFKILFATIMMGTAMEIIILRNPEVFGFVLSILVGATVYLVCALVLGTFEEEDYTLLRSVEAVLPRRAKWVMDVVVSVITQFKSGPTQ